VRRIALVMLVLVAAAALAAGCGESDADTAQAEICSARADIGQSVRDLQSLTPATATANQVQADVESIESGLTTIRDNVDHVDGAARAEIEAATDDFTAELNSIAKGVTSDQSLQGAQARARAARDQLAASYRSTIASIDCS
jgi:hypothetical protein